MIFLLCWSSLLNNNLDMTREQHTLMHSHVMCIVLIGISDDKFDVDKFAMQTFSSPVISISMLDAA